MFRKVATTVAALAVLSFGATAANAKTIGPEIFKAKGCLNCHAVSAYKLDGKAMGPDLSIAYVDVQKKHGKSLEKFLKDPDGIMKGILASAKLTDDESKAIVKLLKDAPKAKK